MSRTKDKIKLEYHEMPTVGGDAVVESGSNSDGEWTRWADGAQVCSGRVENVDTTDASGSIYRSFPGEQVPWNFPQPFSIEPRGFANTTSSYRWMNIVVNDLVSADFKGLSAVSATGTSGIGFVYGRWK